MAMGGILVVNATIIAWYPRSIAWKWTAREAAINLYVQVEEGWPGPESVL